MKYLVVTKGYEKEIFSAIDIDDLLLLLAQYFGKNKPVLQRGLNGCNTTEEKVEMYNALAHFVDDYQIRHIYEIGERIYGEANNE